MPKRQRRLPLCCLLLSLAAGAVWLAAAGADPDGRGVVTPFDAAFTVSSDWGSGFVGEIAVTNRSAGRANRWRLEFEFDRQLQSIWNARVVQHAGQHYVVEGLSWNSWIDAGKSVGFGFTAAPGSVVSGPTGYRLTGELPAPPPPPPPPGSGSVSVRYSTDSDWGSGFVGTITLTNRGTTPVSDWTLDFDFDRRIDSLWNARILLAAAGHFRLGPESWNRSLPAGGELAIGFVGSPGGVAAGPGNFSFGIAAVLRSLELAPLAASMEKGQARQFTATGVYSDGSRRELTGQVEWSSTLPSVATVGNAGSAKGLATAVAAGTTTLQAREPASGIQGSTPLTVTESSPPPPLPGGPLVMGYVETLRSGGSADIPRLNYDAVDVVIHGFGVPLADGRIDTGQGNFSDYLAHGLVGEAHRRGKKILASLGGAVGSHNFAAIAASPALRSTFAANVVALVRANGYDGIDIDDEFPEGSRQTAEFTLLMQEVYAAVKANNPGHLVIFGASPGYFIDSVEWDRIGACSDYAFVMGYDWKNPANGPMTNPGVVQWTAQNHTIEGSVRGAIQFAVDHGYPAARLVMGMPFYGSNNVSWGQVRSLWAAQAPMTPHPQWMEVQLGSAWFTSPECIKAKMTAVLDPARSVLAGRATLGGVGFWEFGHESPADPDLSRAIAEWKAGLR